MDLIDQKVKHKVFGEGIVIAADSKHIKINFGAMGEKTFVYPEVFEKFVVANDASLQSAIMEEINTAKQAAEA